MSQFKFVVFFCFVLFLFFFLQAPNSSIFIGKSTHASKLEILFYKQNTWRKYIHILQI